MNEAPLDNSLTIGYRKSFVNPEHISQDEAIELVELQAEHLGINLSESEIRAFALSLDVHNRRVQEAFERLADIMTRYVTYKNREDQVTLAVFFQHLYNQIDSDAKQLEQDFDNGLNQFKHTIDNQVKNWVNVRSVSWSEDKQPIPEVITFGLSKKARRTFWGITLFLMLIPGFAHLTVTTATEVFKSCCAYKPQIEETK